MQALLDAGRHNDVEKTHKDKWACIQLHVFFPPPDSKTEKDADKV
jgi:hypothetical protein